MLRSEKIIENLFEIAERVSEYILKWESDSKRMKILSKALKKIEKKGNSVFGTDEKVMISEYTKEFGQQVPKIIICISLIEKIKENFYVKINNIKYPNLFSYLSKHKYKGVKYYDKEYRVTQKILEK